MIRQCRWPALARLWLWLILFLFHCRVIKERKKNNNLPSAFLLTIIFFFQWFIMIFNLRVFLKWLMITIDFCCVLSLILMKSTTKHGRKNVKWQRSKTKHVESEMTLIVWRFKFKVQYSHTAVIACYSYCSKITIINNYYNQNYCSICSDERLWHPLLWLMSSWCFSCSFGMLWLLYCDKNYYNYCR